MNIILYTYRGENERVDKTNYLTQIISLEGSIKEQTDIFNPVIKISHPNLVSVNYAFIREFNRYYFIKGIKSVANGLWELSMSVDVLFSFREEIYKQNAIISSQKSEKINRFYNNGVYSTEERTIHKILEFDTPVINGEYGYILTVIGGYATNAPTEGGS